VELHLYNNLEDTGDDDPNNLEDNGFHSELSGTATYFSDVMHDSLTHLRHKSLKNPPGPNTTCIFFHGLRIDPSVNFPFNCAQPGTNIVYKFTIPADHAPGVHW